MNRHLGTLALAVGLLAVALAPVASMAQAAAQPDAAILKQLQGDPAAPKRGVFYQVGNGANTIYLFGTIHVGKPEFYPLNASVIQALAGAGRVWFELDFSDIGALQRMETAGETMDASAAQLSPELARRVAKALGQPTDNAESIRHKKPWALIAELEIAGASDLGYSPIYAADIYLATIAQLLGKPISGLESVDEQMAVLGATSGQDQTAELEAEVSALEDGRSKAELQALVDAWARGDRAALDTAFRSAEGDLPPTLRAMKERLFDQRNVKLADRITTIVRSGTRSFVAIGAGHLVGDGNVVELLRKQGFAVREL
jgi:uncharacterized protein